MANRREKKKIARDAASDEQQARHQRLKWAYAALSLTGLAMVAGGVGFLWEHREGSRTVASTSETAASKSGEKPLKEVEADMLKKEHEQKKAKEWVWGEEGHTELIIQAYQENTKKGSKGHEDRSRILNSLARTVKARKEWPKAFSDEKVNQVLDFLAEILHEDHNPGSDGLNAVNVMSIYAQKIPEYHKKVERAILGYYAADDRPAPRAACLDALAKLQSREAIPYLKTALKSSEYSTSRTALYSLANYLGTPLEAEPRRVMLEAARNDSKLRPLAVKLLAYHGNRSVASLVPILLGKGAGPAEIEAGAYAIERLKLKQYEGLLQNQPTDSPFLQQQLDAASKAVH